jgi:DNA polymerase III sliding clamp (beta) subunit (PCNA family)
MRLELEGSELAKALKAGVAQRGGTSPILQCALIDAADNILRVTTSDLEAEAIAEIPAKVIEAGAVCVNASLLQAAARDGVLKLNQDGTAPLRADPRNGSKLRLASTPAADFPKIEDANWRVLPIDPVLLAKAIASVECAAATTDVRYTLNGVAIMPGYIGATDGHRGGMYRVDYDGSHAIIPIRQLKVFMRLLKEGAEVSGSFDGATKITKLRVRNGDDTLTVRVIDGAYVQLDRVVAEPETEKRAIFDREKLLDAIMKFRPFAGQTKLGSVAYVSVADGAAELLSHQGDNVENLSWALGKHGEPFKVYANIDYLADACGAIGTEKIMLSVAAGGNALFVAAERAEHSPAQHIIMGVTP